MTDGPIAIVMQNGVKLVGKAALAAGDTTSRSIAGLPALACHLGPVVATLSILRCLSRRGCSTTNTLPGFHEATGAVQGRRDSPGISHFKQARMTGRLAATCQKALTKRARGAVKTAGLISEPASSFIRTRLFAAIRV